MLPGSAINSQYSRELRTNYYPEFPHNFNWRQNNERMILNFHLFHQLNLCLGDSGINGLSFNFSGKSPRELGT